MTLLGLVVVHIDLRPELHLFDDGLRLVLAGLAGFHRGLVFELAVVHELGHRGPCHGGDLDEVEICFFG